VTPSFVPKGGCYKDEEDKIRSESRNGVIQANFVLHKISEWTEAERVTPALILKLQELAITQIYRCAGFFRDGPVIVGDGKGHQPPDHTEVLKLVSELCEYLNSNWSALPIHLASYAMWRMNWIHPFYGGNGRSARALSYMVLSVKLGFVLPGTRTLPELIVDNPGPYYKALRQADEAWGKGSLDISVMEELMASLLAKQLLAIHQKATGITHL
jgi:Fic family protein